jgi:hypothetical protein
MTRLNMKHMVLPALTVLGIGAAALSAAQAGSDPASAVRCEIKASRSGSDITLEGMVFAKRTIEGSYNLSVKKSGGAGHSDIKQSGAFNASPGTPGSAGTVTLGGEGTYSATLRIAAEGNTTECVQRTGGAL